MTDTIIAPNPTTTGTKSINPNVLSSVCCVRSFFIYNSFIYYIDIIIFTGTEVKKKK